MAHRSGAGYDHLEVFVDDASRLGLVVGSPTSARPAR